MTTMGGSENVSIADLEMALYECKFPVDLVMALKRNWPSIEVLVGFIDFAANCGLCIENQRKLIVERDNLIQTLSMTVITNQQQQTCAGGGDGRVDPANKQVSSVAVNGGDSKYQIVEDLSNRLETELNKNRQLLCEITELRLSITRLKDEQLQVKLTLAGETARLIDERNALKKAIDEKEVQLKKELTSRASLMLDFVEVAGARDALKMANESLLAEIERMKVQLVTSQQSPSPAPSIALFERDYLEKLHSDAVAAREDTINLLKQEVADLKKRLESADAAFTSEQTKRQDYFKQSKEYSNGLKEEIERLKQKLVNVPKVQPKLMVEAETNTEAIAPATSSTPPSPSKSKQIAFDIVNSSTRAWSVQDLKDQSIIAVDERDVFKMRYLMATIRSLTDEKYKLLQTLKDRKDDVLGQASDVIKKIGKSEDIFEKSLIDLERKIKEHSSSLRPPFLINNERRFLANLLTSIAITKSFLARGKKPLPAAAIVTSQSNSAVVISSPSSSVGEIENKSTAGSSASSSGSQRNPADNSTRPDRGSVRGRSRSPISRTWLPSVSPK